MAQKLFKFKDKPQALHRWSEIQLTFLKVKDPEDLNEAIYNGRRPKLEKMAKSHLNFSFCSAHIK